LIKVSFTVLIPIVIINEQVLNISEIFRKLIILMRLLLLFPILLSKGTSELSYDDCNYSLFCAYAIEE